MIAVWLWVTVAWAVSIDAVPNPRDSGGWVTDLADVIEPAVERDLEQRLERIEAELTVEIAVVTVQQVDAPTPKDFATGLFNHWGVGKAGADNGLLILLVMGQRRLEMETGYGLEATLPDGWLGAMQVRQMVPQFKQGRFDKGLVAGVVAIEERLRKAEAGEVLERAPVRGIRPAERRPSGDDSIGALLGVSGGLVLLGIGGVGYNRWWWRQRTCPGCVTVMEKLSESEDDAYLDIGEQREERIRSVDYEVRVCQTCDYTATFAHTRWFSGYSRCPVCSYRTLGSKSRTLRFATYDSGGLVEITEDCEHCAHHRTYTRSTPRKTRVSTSSGSGGGGGFSGGGGGSFGGGSSGGGGAGSSW